MQQNIKNDENNNNTQVAKYKKVYCTDLWIHLLLLLLFFALRLMGKLHRLMGKQYVNNSGLKLNAG